MRLLLIAVAAIALFLFALAPVTNYDTFFGLKIGETIVKTGHIPHREIFSWAAQGREWIAYEWLPQTWVYLLYTLGGFKAISVYVAFVLAGFFLLLYLLFSRAFKQDFLISLSLSLFLTLAVAEFFVARPQIVAYLAFVSLLYIIFDYLHNHRNRLWLTIPIMYIWINSHASFIIGPYLLLSFTLIEFLQGQIKATKTLLVWALISLGITFLPPLFGKPYLLLYQFSQDLSFISQFIREWNPLATNFIYQYGYAALVSVVLLFGLFRSVISHRWNNWFVVLPLLVVSLASFVAIRHIAFGVVAIGAAFAMFIPTRAPTKKSRVMIVAASMLMIISLLFGWQKHIAADADWALPKDDIKFLKTHKLNGRMYNDFALGGYLLWALYPQYEVFFDGRADIYHTREMRDVFPIMAAKHQDRESFKKAVTTFLSTYNFSYLIIPYESFNPLSFTANTLMADVLLDDPGWSLIYASDHLQILVAHDGQNDEVLKTLATKSITPFRLLPYRQHEEKQAIDEYRRLIATNDSGIVQGGLGFTYLAIGENSKAQGAFSKAISLNKHLGKPYLGLGKIALTNNQAVAAEGYLLKALSLEPYLGDVYLTLGDVYMSQGQKKQAIATWQQALTQPIDFLSLHTIVERLDAAK